MTKGYWIAHVDITDADAYKEYAAGNQVAFAKFGARYLTRGGEHTSPEGPARSRHVVIEFPSYQAALDCYHSDEYQAVSKLRVAASDSELVIIEGYAGAQPGT